MLVKDAGGAVVDSESMDEGGDCGASSLELRTTWWAPSCRPSFILRMPFLWFKTFQIHKGYN